MGDEIQMNRLDTKRGLRNWPLRTAILLGLVFALAFSFFAGEKLYASTHGGIVSYIDGQKENVTLLTLSATTLSAVISTIPDDSCTPIADKLADLSVFLMLALGALYLEKYLLPIVGILSFRAILPASCLLLILGLFHWQYQSTIRRIAVKLIAFAVALLCIIPTSVWISETINTIYGESIQSTLAEATQIEETANEGAEGGQSLWGKITSALQGAVNSVKDAVIWAKGSLSKYTEAAVVLTLTNCVIPVLTILFYYLLIKVLLGTRWEPIAERPRKERRAKRR